MLLAIDIGNTNISFGIFSGNLLIKRFDIPTKNYSLNVLRKKIGKVRIDDSIICSVVPGLSQILQKGLKNLTGKPPFNVGKDIIVPIKNLYRYPKQVGQDRLVNAYAAVRLYGAPLIVIDSGTAITFDIVSKDKEYLGGMILPGLAISLEALARRTALLPKIKLGSPAGLIGRDTRNSILSGIVYGCVELVEGLIKRIIKEKLGNKAKVYATGGSINFIAKYCKEFDKIDRDLTLKGLNLIYVMRQSLVTKKSVASA